MKRKLCVFFLVFSLMGLTFLFLPPVKATGNFSYYANIIYIWGGNESDHIRSIDIWEADQTNGWGEVEKDTSNTSFTFHCGLMFGEDDWGDQFETWFADEAVQWVFDTDASFNVITLSGHSDNHFRLGKLVNATSKTTTRGVDVIVKTSNPHITINDGVGDAEFYSSRFYALDNDGTGTRFVAMGSFTMYECMIEGFMAWIQSQCSPNVYMSTIKNATYGIISYSSTGTWEELFIHETSYAMRFQLSGKVKDTLCLNNTKMGDVWASEGETINLTNIESDNWLFDFHSGRNGEVYRKYSFDLTVTYPNGTTINGTETGARVVLQHHGVNSGVDYNATLGGDGTISTQILSMGFYNITGGNTIYDYNPYTLRIYNVTGYAEYNGNVTLNKKEGLTIALHEPTGGYSGFVFFFLGLIIALVIGVVVGYGSGKK